MWLSWSVASVVVVIVCGSFLVVTSFEYPSDITIASPAVFPVDSFSIPSGFFQIQLGTCATGVGDINNDGTEDFAFGVTYYTPLAGVASYDGGLFVIWDTESFRSLAQIAQQDSSSLLLISNITQGLLITGKTGYFRIGFGISGGCDFNNDGIDDMILSCIPKALSDAIVFVVFGRNGTAAWSSKGTVSISDIMEATQGIKIIPGGSSSNGWTTSFGYFSAQCVGDYNGDKFNDILIGDSQADSGRGRVVLVYGRRSWPLFPAWVDVSTTSSFNGSIFTTSSSAAQLGTSIGALDLNLDGHVDLVISAPGAESNRGQIHVIWGGGSSPLPRNMTLPVTSIDDGWSWKGSQENSNWGCSMTTAGDINGDNNNDLVLGAFGLNQVIVLFSSNSESWSANGSSILDSVSIIDDITGEGFGKTVTTGDINGDGNDEVFIGAISALSGKGRVYIVFGSSSPSSFIITDTSTPDGMKWSRINGNITDGQLGYALGVVHGSIADDLLVSSYRFDSSHTQGVAYHVSHLPCKTKTNGTCTECFPHYSLESTTGKCTSCAINEWSDGIATCAPVSGCLILKEQSQQCKYCQAGYGIITGVCSSCNVESNTWSDGTTTCQSCTSGIGGSGCLKCNAMNGKCTQCSSGFGLNIATGTCKACTGNAWSDGTTSCVDIPQSSNGSTTVVIVVVAACVGGVLLVAIVATIITLVVLHKRKSEEPSLTSLPSVVMFQPGGEMGLCDLGAGSLATTVPMSTLMMSSDSAVDTFSMPMDLSMMVPPPPDGAVNTTSIMADPSLSGFAPVSSSSLQSTPTQQQSQ